MPFMIMFLFTLMLSADRLAGFGFNVEIKMEDINLFPFRKHSCCC